MAPTTQEEELLAGIQLLGYAKGLIDSDPSLSELYRLAVKNKWTAERFTASLPGTEWYKKYNTAQRYAQVLKNQDPATYQEVIDSWKEWIKDQAVAMGATIDEQQLNSFAQKITDGGLTANQATKVFASTFINYNDADLVGRAGQIQDSLNRYNQQYGNILGQSQISNFVRQSMTGEVNDSDILDKIRRTAASTYSNFSDRIMNGETVEDIASPYLELVSTLLETPNVTIKDSLVMDALTGKNDKGGMKYSSLTDFKRAIKSDPRWQQTDNARSEYFDIGQRILKDFGFLG